MATRRKCWQVRDKGQLLLAVMKALEADDARIFFEGDLKDLSSRYPDASPQPADAPRPNTLRHDCIVIPLKPSSSERIYAALGGTVPKTLLHVRIEKGGVLQFGAYDHFHPECIYFGNDVRPATIELLVSEGVIRPVIEKQAKSR